MQIIVNAREKNTKHIPEGALMNLAKYKSERAKYKF